MNDKKTVAIILARGGSKGIPKKNIFPLNNKPLIYYSINTCLKIKEIDEVWVSTDCEEIKSKSIEFGAKVIDRPEHLSTDFSNCEDAIIDFSNKVQYDVLCFVQCTSPLTVPEDIQQGINNVKNLGFDSSFSVCEEPHSFKWNENVQPIGWEPLKRPRRQDMEKVYLENGAFYITTRQQFMNSKNRYGGKIKFVEMPFSRSFQIDTLDELKIIEKIMKGTND